MTALLNTVDPDGLLEFSVVFTDRSLNHMSGRFRRVMTDISGMLKEVYGAEGAVIVPGGGTFAMEAVARQFAGDADVLVVRNGWFSFRWSQILDAAAIARSVTVMKARPQGNSPAAPYAPPPIDEVVTKIHETTPQVVFAPHVETSAGIILPDAYIADLAEAAHAVGAILVLDCIASGCAWVDMAATGVDVLISAPQKGWSAQPCAGLVMLSDRAMSRMQETTSSSFAVDLKAWAGIMAAYESGGHAYHATMPTDALTVFRDTMLETRDYGFDKLKQAQFALGRGARDLLAKRGIRSVAAEGFGAPGVVVSYTDDPDIKSGAKFAALGVQVAAGVPLRVDEPEDFMTFRIGLFGLDKLYDVDATLDRLDAALGQVFA
jgi:aspartate aminotransferase-like enzyme